MLPVSVEKNSSAAAEKQDIVDGRGKFELVFAVCAAVGFSKNRELVLDVIEIDSPSMDAAESLGGLESAFLIEIRQGAYFLRLEGSVFFNNNKGWHDRYCKYSMKFLNAFCV